MAGTRALGRREFVRSAAVLGFGLAGVAVSGVARAETLVRAWTLDPSWGFPRGAHGETSCQCRACRHHAKNKLFASREALEAGRAHVGCLCMPSAVQIPSAAFRALFTKPGRNSADRRDPRVAAVLRSTSDLLAPGRTPDGRGSGGEAGALPIAAAGADLGPLILTVAAATAGVGAVVAARRRGNRPERESP